MLAELSKDPDSGLLGYRLTFGRGGPVVVQYWNSHDKLYAYASAADAEHRPAWTAFNRRARKVPGSVGIWHETYLVDRAETLYAHMAPGGLAAATSAVPVARRGERAKERLAHGKAASAEARHAYPVAVTAPAPGWYADPAGVVQTFRWWDGVTWTRWLSHDPTSTPPRMEAVADARPAAVPPVPAVPDRTVRLPAAVAVTLGALVLAVIAVGAVVSYSADRLPSGPPVDPPVRPAAVHTPISYDPQTRLASVKEMNFMAPAKPFACLPAPNVQPGVFRSYFACDALVHEDYAKAEDWHSSVGFAVLDDPLIVPGDLGKTADKVAETLQAFYPTGQVTIRNRILEDLKESRRRGDPCCCRWSCICRSRVCRRGTTS